MYLANVDVKTAFGEARPGYVAEIMESHHTHGWIISAFLREMARLEGQAMFECVESNFSFDRCLAKEASKLPDCGTRWPHRFWQKCGGELVKEKTGHLLDLEGQRALHVGRQLLGQSHSQVSPRTDAGEI